MIVLDDVTLGYHRHPAVHHVSGHFAEGTLTAVVGPNGAGKSTVLKGMVGLIPTLSGRVEYRGCRRRDVAYAPQVVDMDMSFPLTVLDVVALGDWSQVGALGRVTAKIQTQARYALKQVGLEGFETRAMDSLSVGQRQRVLFARVIMADAPVILLDEPFAAVDANTTQALLEIVKVWKIMGKTVVAVVHDLDQVRAQFPQALLMARECVAWGPTDQVLTEDNLRIMTMMAQSWDDNAPVCERRGKA